MAPLNAIIQMKKLRLREFKYNYHGHKSDMSDFKDHAFNILKTESKLHNTLGFGK